MSEIYEKQQQAARSRFHAYVGFGMLHGVLELACGPLQLAGQPMHSIAYLPASLALAVLTLLGDFLSIVSKKIELLALAVPPPLKRLPDVNLSPRLLPTPSLTGAQRLAGVF